MSDWQKWSDMSYAADSGDRLVCVLYVSRNKDNAGVPSFSQRRRAFLARVPAASFMTYKQYFAQSFASFVRAGLLGETSRLYVSVNARDNEAVRRHLLERLIFDESLSMAALPSVACGIAAKKECAAERRWMFDFDPPRGHDDYDLVESFVMAVESAGRFDSGQVRTYETPHGYAVICDHGFDVRPVMSEWGSMATLKRDDMLCVDWVVNDAE